MKKVAVIGATGFVGSQVVKELADRGYDVVAIARDSSKVPKGDHIDLVSLDVADERLADVLKGTDAVISAFNAGWTNPNLYEDYLAGARSIQRAVEASGVKRFIVVGGAGSLFVDGQQLVDDPSFPKEIKGGALAVRDYLNELKDQDQLDWTFFSPAIEMNPNNAGVRTGVYRTGTENPVFDQNGRSNLSVGDVAVALVDELENEKFVKQRFTAGY